MNTKNNPGLIVPFEAGAAIKPYSLVKLKADGTVIPAAADTDVAIGAVQQVGASKAGVTVDVTLDGIVLLRAKAAQANPSTVNWVFPDTDGTANIKAWADDHVSAGIWVDGKLAAANDLFSALLTRQFGGTV